MFTLWSQTLPNFAKKQVIRLYLPLKLTQINQQIVYRYYT